MMNISCTNLLTRLMNSKENVKYDFQLWFLEPLMTFYAPTIDKDPTNFLIFQCCQIREKKNRDALISY